MNLYVKCIHLEIHFKFKYLQRYYYYNYYLSVNKYYNI